MEDRFKKGMKILNITNENTIEDIFKDLEDIAPDMGKFIVEFPYSEIYTRKTLDLKTREICTVAALTAMGHPQAELKDHINGNLAVGIKPEEIIEIIMQMSAYAGFPAAINGIMTAKELFKEKGVLPLKIPDKTEEEKNDERTRHEKGIAILKETKDLEEEKILKELGDFVPAMRRFVIEFPYAEIYTRPTIPLRLRELCTVAALTAMGHPQAQLKVHIEAALNVGNTPEEIVEIIMQMSAYSGFPTAINGIMTAKELFKEKKLLPLKTKNKTP